MDSGKSRAEPAAEERGASTSDAWFRRHARAVFAVCLANTGDYHDAEDVMQAVFVKAIKKARGLRDPERARAWLLQVARRECVNLHRGRKPAKPLLEEPAAPPPEENPVGERLHRAILELPPSYREAIILYYLDGRDSAGVAASLGTTQAAVRQRLVRARTMLHDLLREDEP